MGSALIEILKDGTRIMSIEARYIYSANKPENNQDRNGYITTNVWGKENLNLSNAGGSKKRSKKKIKIPEHLYSVKIPYSLGMEKMYETNPEEFKQDDFGHVYTDMVVNVTFRGAAKRIACKRTRYGKYKLDSDGNKIKSKPKYIIKSAGTGYKRKSWIKKVDRLEIEKNKDALREYLYENGFIINGQEYVAFMRSTSKSRGGNMLFIKAQYLISILYEWARLNIEIPSDMVVDVAGIKSYEALALSGICAKLRIRPDEILLVKDYKSSFMGMASVTRQDETEKLVTSDEINEFSNDIWDGMSLLQTDKWDELLEFEGSKSMNGSSFLLLRNVWFKSAAFRTDIQRFFSDNRVTLGDVKINGWTMAKDISDIKMITTPNSLKILKINKLVENKYPNNVDGHIQSMFEYWLDFVGKGNDYFGIVKCEHEARNHARTCNSQILQALPLIKDDIRDLLNTGEFPYMDAMRNDEGAFIYHIKNRNSTCDRMIYDLGMSVPDFTKTELYKNFKNTTLNDYKENWKVDGIKIPDSDFCVAVSNPIELLQYASGIAIEDWIHVHMGREAFCSYYENGQELLAARNPCVASGNIICLKNKVHKLLNQYMRLSNNIVVVNSIESDIMDRASGMDFDSDQLWLSSNPTLVDKAKICEENFLTTVCKIAREDKEKFNIIEDLSDTDSQISKSRVGDIVNIGQIFQSYYWHIYFTSVPRNAQEQGEKNRVLKLLYDKISMLSSMSGVEIDRAKREYKMDTKKELEELRNIGLNNAVFKDYIHYGKQTNVRKTTITDNEMDELGLTSLYEQYEMLIKKEAASDIDFKKKSTLFNEISSILNEKHKKNPEKTRTKIIKPKYFQYMFPESKDSSLFSEKGFNCPMDNLIRLIGEECPRKRTRDGKVNFMDLLYEFEGRSNDKQRKKIKEIAAEYDDFCKCKSSFCYKKDEDKGITKKDFFYESVGEVSKIDLKQVTIVSIFNECYGSNQAKSHSNISHLKKHMLDLIYAAHSESVKKCFKQGKEIYDMSCYKKQFFVGNNNS